MWQSIKNFFAWTLGIGLLIVVIVIYVMCVGGGNPFKQSDKATFTWDDTKVEGPIKATTFTDKETGQDYIIITTDKGGVSITPRLKK